MEHYSGRSINLATLVVTIIIFVQINFLFFQLVNLKQNSTVEVKLGAMEEVKKEITTKTEEKWELKIPKIQLEANIKDGTEGEIINSYIGHFKETAYETGNIGLAAHNEGYKENYFEKLYLLEEGDRIYYQKGNFKKEYKVIFNAVIEETDWTYLRNTQDNRITLITCINNEATQRRCIQAFAIE